MATVFIPPTAPLRPFVKRASDPHARFWSHFRPADAGLNLWLLDDMTVVTEQSWLDAGVLRTFHGGHIHEVDEAEAAALTAAGYGEYLTEVADAAVQTGFTSGTAPTWSGSLPPQSGI